MAIPILGSSSSYTTSPTVCVMCGGDISDPNHEHIYVDVRTLNFFKQLIESMVTNGCVVVDPSTGNLLLGHPRLKEGYVWAPVAVNPVE